MPRKASQGKKDAASAESKTEVGTTRRSGRSVTKQETVSGKEASRSRRSSTAAQTAASVADSGTPKGRRSSSRRDSASPVEERKKSRRESADAPSRSKSARRATSRVNYKESDGEEEAAAPKFEETFDSNEEFEESESDEKSKPKGRTRSVKTPAKGRGAKAKVSRSRRGRPAKKQSSDEEDEEENIPIELSEDSVEVDEESTSKKAKETPAKENTRAGRGRRGKTDNSDLKVVEDKPKSRRSARAVVTPKDEPARKRPTRGVQAKKYTEDDDDEIEEIDDTKGEAVKPVEEAGRKRKRGSVTEPNKRLKDEESAENVDKAADEADAADVDAEESSEPKPDTEAEKEEKSESADEAMEVDATDSADKGDDSKPSPTKGEKEVESKIESPEKKESTNKSTEESKSPKEKLFPNKQGSVDSSENLDESMHSFDSDQGSRAEQSISSGLEDSQDIKETKPAEKAGETHQDSGAEKVKPKVVSQPDSSNSFQELDDSSESKGETSMNNEQKQGTDQDKSETKADSKLSNSAENIKNDIAEYESVETEKAVDCLTPMALVHSKESKADTSLNGSEKPPSNPAHVIHSTSTVNLHPEDSAPKANGAHDLHNNSVSENDQYYPFPGRKYIINAKLGDSIRQSVKDKSFGFVSYNLGVSSSDSSIQKEKLLNELNKLDAHIICIQQVSKPFYSGILEPSLDALGFKGTFSQPEESEKGIATFYKSSLFRLSGQSEASLKHLIEKELEVSSLEANDRMAVKTHVKKCGHVLFTHFATVIGMHSLTVANVQVPPTDLSIHALQVSCLAREVVRVNGGTGRSFLLGGEFNMMESEAPYQLLRDGYLSNDMIEELQRRKDVVLPGKENAALVNLLWKSFQHPSSTLCSCYKSVLDHEVFIPEQKATSPDLLWYSSDSLYTIGVLDTSETDAADRHFSLKADIAFSM